MLITFIVGNCLCTQCSLTLLFFLFPSPPFNSPSWKTVLESTLGFSLFLFFSFSLFLLYGWGN